MKSYIMRFGTGDPRTYTGMAPTFLIFTTAAGATIAPPGISEALAGSGLYYFNWGTTTAIAFLADSATTSPGTSGRYVTGAIDPADRSDEYGNTLVAIGNTLIFNTPNNMGGTLVAIGNTSIAIGLTLTANLPAGFGTSFTALGNTLFALGTTSVALGITNVALGNSNIALGTSNIAFGASNFALGSSIYALEQNLGSTLVGIGNTAIALGITNVAIGTSLSATSVTIVVTVAGIGSAGSTFGGVGSDPIDLFGYMKRIQENLEGNSLFTKLTGAWAISSRGASVVLANKVVINTSTNVTKS